MCEGKRETGVGRRMNEAGRTGQLWMGGGHWECPPVINVYAKQKTEVPRFVRTSKVRKQDTFRRDWYQH